MAEKKEKQYVSDNAQLMAEWDWGKNNGLGIDPQNLTCGSNKKVWWKCDKGHEWQAVIGSRNSGYGCPYCSGRLAIEGQNDLQTLNPILAEEWNFERNIGLTPTNIMACSGKKVWWRCSKGHEWQAIVANRNYGNGCPYCASQRVLEGYNDLQTVNPVLTAEWNYEKNDKLTPSDVLSNSNKKVWWRCKKGHEWQAIISHRNSGSGCPYCLNKKVLKGYNDLQTTNPLLAKEWNYRKNGNLKPENYTANSGKRVWWNCCKGHEWQATINDRSRATSCPLCKSERNTSFPEYALLYYFRQCNLEVIHSYKEQGYELDIYIPSKKIAIEFDGFFWHKNKVQKDIEKNQKCVIDGIKLYRIREGLLSLNDSSVDYVVQKNHNDLSVIIGEILSEITGFEIDVDLTRDAIAIENLREYKEKENSILFLNSTIANEWNYEKNGNLKPDQFTSNSGKKVWWKCTQGHEWQARIANRNFGRGCPYCAGKKVFRGQNDLQSINPILAKEWNIEKNIGITPMDVMPNSSKKVWWRCSRGHEWQAVIASRNKGNGCPYCKGSLVWDKRMSKLIEQQGSLETQMPLLAKEWHPTKNEDLLPSEVTLHSGRKVWWQCSCCGHEWAAVIGSRSKGVGCPECARNKRKKN